VVSTSNERGATAALMTPCGSSEGLRRKAATRVLTTQARTRGLIENITNNNNDLNQSQSENNKGIFENRVLLGVYNQCESFIYLDLIIKNKKVPIERYFKRWTSIKLVWIRYQNY
jgi:hypothetical protein